MTTYWVYGKGVPLNQILPQGPMQAGIPQAQTPSLQRQISHHTSLAAVVVGMMQASKRSSNINATRKSFFSNALNCAIFSSLDFNDTIRSDSTCAVYKFKCDLKPMHRDLRFFFIEFGNSIIVLVFFFYSRHSAQVHSHREFHSVFFFNVVFLTA